MDVSQIHHQAEVLREDEKFLESLKLYQEVILLCQQLRDYQRLADALLGELLTYKHLYINSKDDVFIYLGLFLGKTSLKIIKKHNLNLVSRAYYRIAEIYNVAGQFEKADKYLSKSLKTVTDSEMEKGNILTHLGELRQDVILIEKGIDHINRFKEMEDQYTYKVWISGAYLKMATVLYQQNNSEYKNYINQASKVIASDSRLVIRQKQLSEIKQKLGVK